MAPLKNRISPALFFIIGVIFMLTCASSVFAADQKSSIITVGKARFSVMDKECIRLEYSETGKFVDAPSYFAINRNTSFKNFKLTKSSAGVSIDTGIIKLDYKQDGKPFSEKNIKATIKKGNETITWTPGMPNDGNLGGTIRTVDGVYGPVYLGEGVLSKDGWYLLDDSRRHIYTKDWIEERPKDAGTDWYLFGYGYDYAGALKAMTAIGGDVPLPRKYSLGAWYSRYWPYSSKDYRDIIDEYSSHDFPLDVIVMDMDWHRDGWTGWSWNRDLLPDAEELLKWYHERNLAITLNLHPAEGVGSHEDAYNQFMKDMGKDPSTKEKIPFDAGSKKYMDTIIKDVMEPLENEGVDFWWLDWQQYPYTLSIQELTNLSWLNHLFFNHTGSGDKRGLSFSRWAGWGDHRHPIHFSGDAHTGWPMLAFEVPLTSTAGNIGAFFWSHDIGGHMGGRNTESYVRWVQFGATSAALRSHSTRSADMDRRPWTYDKWAEDSMRISFHLRSVIFPYIYSTAWQAHNESIPMNRPLYFLTPKDEQAYKNPQEYLYGDAMLAAPVAMPGVGAKRIGTQVVRFPSGLWYNWFTGEKFMGGTEIVAAADIDEFPFYIKGGVPVPMQPYAERMASEPLKLLVVRCYPGEDGKTGKYTLYEDDGISKDYLKGKFATTGLTCSRNKDNFEITIGAAKGTYKGQLKKRAYRIELAGTSKAGSVKIDGKTAKSTYEQASSINIINVPSTAVSKKVKITIKAAQADFNALKLKAEQQRVSGLLGDNYEKGDSLKDAIIKYSSDSEQEQRVNDALYAVGGASFFKKNEGVYLYNGKETVYLYLQPGLFDGDKCSISISDIHGENEKEIYSDNISITKPIRLTTPAGLPPLEPGNDEFGSAVKRMLTVSFSINGKKLSISRAIETKLSWIRKWNITGTFDYDTSKSLDSQKYTPETGEVNLKDHYQGFSGKFVNWTKAKTGDNNLVDLNKHFMIPVDRRIAYGVTFLYSDEPQEATFWLNSDDGAQAWLNGKQILLSDASRSIDLDPDIFKGKLEKGRNVLLVKISQTNRDWEFKAAVETRKPLKSEWK